MMSNWQNFTAFGTGGFGMGGLTLILLLVWSLIWKGLALWKSAHRNEKVWFVALLIINTVGILEILYLYVFSRDKNKEKQGPVV